MNERDALPHQPIPSVEQQHPWLRWLYAAAFLGAIAASAIARACGAPPAMF